MKKLLLTAAAVAMPVGLVAATGSVASAGAPKVDVTNATIACTSVTGQVKFAPALNGSGGQPTNSQIKLALGGCTVAGGPGGVTISAGKGTGVLHLTDNSAGVLVGTHAVTGQVNIKWTSNVKLTSKMSTVTVTAVTGGTSGSYGSFTVNAGDASVSGDFQGSDNGASSNLYAETTDTTATLGAEVAGKHGLKKTTLGTDGTHLLPNSLNLG